jgi:hypothetical protein
MPSATALVGPQYIGCKDILTALSTIADKEMLFDFASSGNYGQFRFPCERRRERFESKPVFAVSCAPAFAGA